MAIMYVICEKICKQYVYVCMYVWADIAMTTCMYMYILLCLCLSFLCNNVAATAMAACMCNGMCTMYDYWLCVVIANVYVYVCVCMCGSVAFRPAAQ